MIKEPNCSLRQCIHFLGVFQPDGTEKSEIVCCRAFSDGIPSEIAYGENEHLSPLPNQKNSIIFKKKIMAKHEIYMEKIYPLVEKFFKENHEILKSLDIYDKIAKELVSQVNKAKK